MDDIIIIHKDKKYLRKLLNEMIIVARDELYLEFNDKTNISPLHKGISFLGWKIKPVNKYILMTVANEKKRLRVKTNRH